MRLRRGEVMLWSCPVREQNIASADGGGRGICGVLLRSRGLSGTFCAG
jgi:hypothetical protein